LVQDGKNVNLKTVHKLCNKYYNNRSALLKHIHTTRGQWKRGVEYYIWIVIKATRLRTKQ